MGYSINVELKPEIVAELDRRRAATLRTRRAEVLAVLDAALLGEVVMADPAPPPPITAAKVLEEAKADLAQSRASRKRSKPPKVPISTKPLDGTVLSEPPRRRGLRETADYGSLLKGPKK